MASNKCQLQYLCENKIKKVQNFVVSGHNAMFILKVKRWLNEKKYVHYNT